MTSRRRSLGAIYLILVVDVLGAAILIPLLPFYAEHFGATPLTIGWLGVIYAGCQLVAGPILGALSDRYGRRRLLLLSQAGTLMGFLLLAYSPSFLWLCIARAIDGATAGNVSVAHAHVADVTSPAERGQVFALMATAFGVAFILGPTVGGLLVVFGYAVPIFVAAGLSAVSIGLTYALLPRQTPAAVARRPVGTTIQLPFRRLAALSQEHNLRLPLARFALFALSFSLYFFGIALFAERRLTLGGHPFGPREVGFVFLVTSGVSLLFQLAVTRRLLARFGEEAVVGGGFTAAGVGYAILSVAASPLALGAALLSLAAGNAVLRPALTGLISRQGRPGEQGLTMGALQSLYSLADLLAPILAGWLIAHGWLTGWALLMAVLAGAGLCPWLVTSKEVPVWQES